MSDYILILPPRESPESYLLVFAIGQVECRFGFEVICLTQYLWAGMVPRYPGCKCTATNLHYLGQTSKVILDKITHPFLKCNKDFTKPLMNLGYGLVWMLHRGCIKAGLAQLISRRCYIELSNYTTITYFKLQIGTSKLTLLGEFILRILEKIDQLITKYFLACLLEDAALLAIIYTKCLQWLTNI